MQSEYPLCATATVTEVGTKTSTACYVGGEGPFEPCDYCTYTQGAWGKDKPKPWQVGGVLEEFFADVYGTELVVGIPDPNFAMTFKKVGDLEPWDAIRRYLPGGGPPGDLKQNYINPVDTTSGILGAQVLTLKLNVDYSVGGYLPPSGSSCTTVAGNLGNLYYCPVVIPDSLYGEQVSSILAVAEKALGRGLLPTGYSFGSLNDLITNLNEAFDDCGDKPPTTWAQTHLSKTGCP